MTSAPPLPELEQRISAEFPQLTWQGAQLITEGWDHAVVILDDRLVFRFPLEIDDRDALVHESQFLRLLKPMVVARIPQYEYMSADLDFAGYAIVPGSPLSPTDFDQLSPGDQTEFVTQLARFLTVMHGIHPAHENLPPLCPFYLPAEQEEVRRVLDRDVRAHLTDEEYQLARSILDEVDDVLSVAPTDFVIHGDIYRRHLLWDAAERGLGIIDFSDMGWGDPAMDFAELYEYGTAFVRNVYDLYTGPKDDTFLDRAWIYQKWIGVYMLTDHFLIGKTTFEVARETFDRVRVGRR